MLRTPDRILLNLACMQAVTAQSTVGVNTGLKALLLALTLALLGIIGWNLRDTSVREGDRAPEFSVRSDQGIQLAPTDFGGKVLVLNFWATWCQPCVTETPSLSAFQRKFKDKGVVVLGISIDKNQESINGFCSGSTSPSILTAIRKQPSAPNTARFNIQKLTSSKTAGSCASSSLIRTG